MLPAGYQGLQIYKFNSTTNNHFTQLAVLTSYPESGLQSQQFSDAERTHFNFYG